MKYDEKQGPARSKITIPLKICFDERGQLQKEQRGVKFNNEFRILDIVCLKVVIFSDVFRQSSKENLLTGRFSLTRGTECVLFFDRVCSVLFSSSPLNGLMKSSNSALPWLKFFSIAFDKCIQEKHLKCFETAKVILLHKIGHKTDPSNYGPVSLLIWFHYEKSSRHFCTNKRMVKFAKILTHVQYGFRKRRSCNDTFISVTEFMIQLIMKF